MPHIIFIDGKLADRWETDIQVNDTRSGYGSGELEVTLLVPEDKKLTTRVDVLMYSPEGLFKGQFCWRPDFREPTLYDDEGWRRPGEPRKFEYQTSKAS